MYSHLKKNKTKKVNQIVGSCILLLVVRTSHLVKGSLTQPYLQVQGLSPERLSFPASIAPSLPGI